MSIWQDVYSCSFWQIHQPNKCLCFSVFGIGSLIYFGLLVKQLHEEHSPAACGDDVKIWPYYILLVFLFVQTFLCSRDLRFEFLSNIHCSYQSGRRSPSICVFWQTRVQLSVQILKMTTLFLTSREGQINKLISLFISYILKVFYSRINCQPYNLAWAIW